MSVDYCLEPTNITVYKAILQAGLKIQYCHKAILVICNIPNLGFFFLIFYRYQNNIIVNSFGHNNLVVKCSENRDSPVPIMV